MHESSSDTGKMSRPHRLRVLLVSTSFPSRPGDVSGIFVRRLADALSESVSLEVLTPCGREVFASDAAYPVHCFRYAPRAWQALTHRPGGIPAALKRRPAYGFVLFLMLLSLFMAVYRRAGKVDVIHANWSLTGLICGLAGRLRGCPVITTLRGSDVARLETSRPTRLLTAWTLKLSHHTVAVSSAMTDELRARFPQSAARLSHIPNGVDDVLRSLPLPEAADTLKIAAVGNLIPGKAVHELLRALAGCDGSLSMETTVVGDGPERESLEALACDLGLPGKVRFAGNLPPHAVAAVLGESDVFVLTSHSEGRPNVVVEAMAAGRAIVATALPGVCELLEHERNGLVFDPGDTDELAAYLQRLAVDPALRLRLGRAARQTVAEQGLTWQSTAERYHVLYRQSRGLDPACVD
jgi:glycosyltransferase involved in cell wall biosynthesis